MPKQIEVWKDNKSTIIHDTELSDYTSRGYTQEGGGVSSPSFIKNPEYNPNDPSVKRYIPSGEGLAGLIQQPEAPQVAKNGAMAGYSAPEGIKAAFGEGWQPGDIFKERGLLDRGIEGAVRIKGGQDVFTVGEKGKWIETPEEYEKLFGTREQAGIVGEITPEQAKLLGIRPEGVAELKASRQKDKEMKELFDYAQQAGLSWEETMSLVESQFPSEKTDRKASGIQDVVDELFNQPTTDEQANYDKYYIDEGLPEIRDKIKDIDDEIQKGKNDLAKATGQINANPWISESSRVGKMRVLNERAEETINNLIEKRKMLLGEYDVSMDKVEKKMIREREQRKERRQWKADELNWLLQEEERLEDERREKRQGEMLRMYGGEFLRGEKSGDFTTTQKQKLEQVGLLDASRQDQLNYLYGKKATDGGGGVSGGTLTERRLAVFEDIKSQLRESIGEDGYVNTALYGQLKLQAPDVFKYLPPEELLNPNDPTALKYFQTPTQAVRKTDEEGGTDEDNALKAFLEGGEEDGKSGRSFLEDLGIVSNWLFSK